MMKVKRDDQTPSGASRSRLYDDGYQDAKLGRAILSSQLFESPVDFQIYRRGYDDAVALGDALKKVASQISVRGRSLSKDSFSIELEPGDNPFISCSGVSVHSVLGSGYWDYKK